MTNRIDPWYLTEGPPPQVGDLFKVVAVGLTWEDKDAMPQHVVLLEEAVPATPQDAIAEILEEYKKRQEVSSERETRLALK